MIAPKGPAREIHVPIVRTVRSGQTFRSSRKGEAPPPIVPVMRVMTARVRASVPSQSRVPARLLHPVKPGVLLVPEPPLPQPEPEPVVLIRSPEPGPLPVRVSRPPQPGRLPGLESPEPETEEMPPAEVQIAQLLGQLPPPSSHPSSES